MALIEHRQASFGSQDVVIATFSMIDELSEPNWKLCIRTDASSPLDTNHSLIMATLMVCFRKSWTIMSAEAQMQRGARVKPSLEAASLTHSGYVNYQLGRSGEVKAFIMGRSYQQQQNAALPSHSANAAAAAAFAASARAASIAAASGGYTTADAEEQTRWTYCPTPA